MNVEQPKNLASKKKKKEKNNINKFCFHILEVVD